MTCTLNGRVGIGTTSPQALTHIKSSAARSSSGQEVLRIGADFGSGTPGSGPALTFGDSANALVGKIVNAAESDNGSGLGFWTMNSSFQVTEKMRISGSGNVGIGTTSPSSLLSVGNTSQFQINSSGIIAAIDGVAHTIDDVSGNLTLTSNSTTVSINDNLSIAGNITTIGGVAHSIDNNSGNLRLTSNSNTIELNDNVTFAGTTTLNSLTYTWPGSHQSSGYVLSNNGSGTLSWVDPASAASGAIYWLQSNGALFPKNATVDLLVGGSATTSADADVSRVFDD